MSHMKAMNILRVLMTNIYGIVMAAILNIFLTWEIQTLAIPQI